MYYLVTEDENSARDFWSIVISTYVKSGEYEIEPLQKGKGGNTTLRRQVQSVMNRAKSGDVLFVALDNVDNNRYFNTSDFILNTYAQCNAKGVTFRYTEYYCFEEIYLSYSEVIRMSNSKYKCTLEYVRNCMESRKDYFNNWGRNESMKEFIGQYADKNINKERFANLLLVEVTNSIPGHFRISKRHNVFNSRGECWLHSCDDVRNKLTEGGKNLRAMNVCNNQCTYYCKGCDTRSKIRDLNVKSVIKMWWMNRNDYV